MPTFERYNGPHLAARVRTYDKGEIAAHRRLVEDGVDGWREVDDPGTAAAKPLTPKQRLQVDAEALGLSTDGTADELTARIDAKVAELLTQAKELGIDGDKLSGPELLAAVDAKLAE